MDDGAIFCPKCARAHPPTERFCDACGMPLVKHPVDHAEVTVSERRQAARKIKPEYAEGELVKVAVGRELAQAEFIAGLLLEEGIPSVLRGSIDGHGPLSGSRDILVPESGAQAAREALSWRES
jgi:Putative prokaryotic signal transducing protein